MDRIIVNKQLNPEVNIVPQLTFLLEQARGYIASYPNTKVVVKMMEEDLEKALGGKLNG